MYRFKMSYNDVMAMPIGKRKKLLQLFVDSFADKHTDEQIEELQ